MGSSGSRPLAEVELNRRLDGTVAIVTGAAGALGSELATELVLRGCHVIIAGRSIEKLNQLKNKIEEIRTNSSRASLGDDEERLHLNSESTATLVTPLTINLNSLQSVRDFVHAFRQLALPLHYLVNNAGILSINEATHLVDGLTVDGFNPVLQTNYLSPFYLTALLLPILLSTAISLLPTPTDSSTAPSYRFSRSVRVVNVSSMAHHLSTFRLRDLESVLKSPPSGVWQTYGDSKLLQIFHSSHLCSLVSLRHPFLPFITASVAPGIVYSSIGESTTFTRAFCCLAKPFLRTPAQGVKPILWVLLNQQRVTLRTSGEYWESCNQGDRSSRSDTPIIAEEVWQITLQIIREWESTQRINNTMQV